MVRADAPRVTVATATAPEQWIDWPGASLPADVQPAITTGNPGQALSSVLAGLGRSILPMPLVEEAIAAGKLEILEGPSDSRRAYWLVRSEEHTSELQSLMRISYAVFCLKKNTKK